MTALRNHILALIQGKAESTTEITAYLIEKVKNLQARSAATEANIEQSQRQLESFRLQWTKLNAQQEAYAEDLEFWVQKEQDAAKSKSKAIDNEQSKPEDTIDGHSTTSGESLAGSDQHRDEGPGTPKEVAPGVRTPVVDIQRKGSSGGPPVAWGGTSTGGDNLGVSGPSESNRNRAV